MYLTFYVLSSPTDQLHPYRRGFKMCYGGIECKEKYSQGFKYYFKAYSPCDLLMNNRN